MNRLDPMVFLPPDLSFSTPSSSSITPSTSSMSLCLHPNHSYLSYSFGSLKVVAHNENLARRPFFDLPIINLPFHIPRQLSHSLPIISSPTLSSPRSPSPIISDHSSLHSIVEASRQHKFPLPKDEMTADAAIVIENALNERFDTNRNQLSFSPPVSLLRKVAHWIVTSNFDEKPTND